MRRANDGTANWGVPIKISFTVSFYLRAGSFSNPANGSGDCSVCVRLRRPTRLMRSKDQEPELTATIGPPTSVAPL